jgi:guanine deaminase
MAAPYTPPANLVRCAWERSIGPAPTRLVFAASHQDAASIAGFDDQFIYEELEKEFDQRKIPATQLLREEGLEPFLEWKEKEDKRRY